MKTITQAISVGLLSGFASVAVAGEKINRSLDVSSNVFVEIEHVFGKAEIIGWDQDTVKVTGELSDRTTEVVFEKSGDEVKLEVEVEKRRRGGWNEWDIEDGDDLVIYIPMSASVDYQSVNANVQVQNVNHSVQLEVVNGRIEASDLSGRVRIESVNASIEGEDITGSLNIENVNGRIRVQHDSSEDLTIDSVNGDIKVQSKAGDARLESVNGDVELSVTDAKDLEVNTVNGDMEISVDMLSNAKIELSSVGGDIELTLPNNPNARFEIEAHAGGRIINGITDDKMQKAKYGPRRWLEFSTGAADSDIELSTVNGRVEIKDN